MLTNSSIANRNAPAEQRPHPDTAPHRSTRPRCSSPPATPAVTREYSVFLAHDLPPAQADPAMLVVRENVLLAQDLRSVSVLRRGSEAVSGSTSTSDGQRTESSVQQLQAFGFGSPLLHTKAHLDPFRPTPTTHGDTAPLSSTAMATKRQTRALYKLTSVREAVICSSSPTSARPMDSPLRVS